MKKLVMGIPKAGSKGESQVLLPKNVSHTALSLLIE
jgi:hypothetical protein